MALWLQLSQFLELIFVSNCVVMSNFRCLYFCTTQIRRPILPSGFQYIPHPSINRSSLKKGRLAEWKGGPWKFTLNELITAPIWHCMPATENKALIAPSRHNLTLKGRFSKNVNCPKIWQPCQHLLRVDTELLMKQKLWQINCSLFAVLKDFF